MKYLPETIPRTNAHAIDSVVAAFRVFGARDVITSFNGGKEATVILYLMLIALTRTANDGSRNCFTSTKDSDTAGPDNDVVGSSETTPEETPRTRDIAECFKELDTLRGKRRRPPQTVTERAEKGEGLFFFIAKKNCGTGRHVCFTANT